MAILSRFGPNRDSTAVAPLSCDREDAIEASRGRHRRDGVRFKFIFHAESAPCNFLLLLALDRLDAFPLDFYRGGFLFGRLLEGALLARAETSGPFITLSLPHQIISATFDQSNFVLPPLLKKIISTVRELRRLHAPPKSFFLARPELVDRDAAVQARLEGPRRLGVEPFNIRSALAHGFE